MIESALEKGCCDLNLNLGHNTIISLEELDLNRNVVIDTMYSMVFNAK